MANFIAETAKISPHAIIDISSRGTHTYIGENTVVDDFVKIKHVGGTGDIKIGEQVFLNSGTVIYSGNGVTIGNNVLIGPNCSITPVNHNISDTSKTIQSQGFAPSKGGIVIENDVWIGSNVAILDGAIIRQGAVIGSNSMVNKEVEAYTVNAGSPVKRIRFR